MHIPVDDILTRRPRLASPRVGTVPREWAAPPAREALEPDPLEALLQDVRNSEIIISGPRCVSVVRAGEYVLTEVTFRDEAQLVALMQKIGEARGLSLDLAHPRMITTLEDGSEVIAAIPPASYEVPTLHIRRRRRP